MATKFETKSAITRLCIRYLRDPCAEQGLFEVGLLNDVPGKTNSTTSPRPTLVAMATKFQTKSDITRFVQDLRYGDPVHQLVGDISPRSLRLTEGFRVKLCSQSLRRPTLVAISTKSATQLINITKILAPGRISFRLQLYYTNVYITRKLCYRKDDRAMRAIICRS